MKKDVTGKGPQTLTEDELAACNGAIALPDPRRVDIADLTYLGLDGSQHGQE